MKTTIEISDPLLMKAKQLAASEGITLRSLIEQGLRQVVEKKPPVTAFRLRRATFKGNGLQPGLRGAGWDRVRDMIYEDRGG